MNFVGIAEKCLNPQLMLISNETPIDKAQHLSVK